MERAGNDSLLGLFSIHKDTKPGGEVISLPTQLYARKAGWRALCFDAECCLTIGRRVEGLNIL